MGEIINLRRVRKVKARARAAAQAAVARAKFGRSHAERDAADQNQKLDDQRHAAHQREQQDPQS